MVNDSTGTRFKHFIAQEKITQLKVASLLDVTPQYINNVCTGRQNVSKKLAAKLQDVFGVNAGWLLTGQGKMRIDDNSNDSYSLSENNDEAEKPRINYENGRPYYNVSFMLGFDTLINDQTQNPDFLINFPPYNDCDYWCNAYGDSMAPTIASGDIVALKRIHDISYLINGEIYAIVTSNGLRTIKRVRDNGTTLTLSADNTHIDEQTIPKSLVTHIFRVLGCIKIFN